jgi:hypothetical protein
VLYIINYFKIKKVWETSFLQDGKEKFFFS